MPRLSPTLTLAALLAVAPLGHAADPDPIELLRASAQTVAEAPSASVDLTVNTLLVRDEEVSDTTVEFAYRTAPEGRFEFVTVDPKAENADTPPKFGFLVAGNGQVTLTAVLGRRRHMLEDDDSGLAAFANSPAVAGIGSGLGGVALSFLNPAAAESLIESIKQSEFVGEETVDGETQLHARYTLEGDVTADVWFATGSEPLVRRIKPDVASAASVQSLAKRHDKFDYQLTFDFENWNTEAGLTAEDLAVEEPNGSLLMASLYEPPAPRPHSLVGREAPVFTLPTAGGDEVDLAQQFGEEVVLLEFWATNCPYCIKAMPELEKLEEEYKERGLGYYAVNVGETQEEVAAFLEKQNLTPTALLDEDGEVATAYDVGPIPLILLIGRDGKVQAASEGFSPNTPETLATQIEATLEGKDLAEEQLAAAREVEAERMAERKRLKSLLDG